MHFRRRKRSSAKNQMDNQRACHFSGPRGLLYTAPEGTAVCGTQYVPRRSASPIGRRVRAPCVPGRRNCITGAERDRYRFLSKTEQFITIAFEQALLHQGFLARLYIEAVRPAVHPARVGRKGVRQCSSLEPLLPVSIEEL